MFHICVLIAVFTAPTPPDAQIAPQVSIEHGITRVDPYAWMRDRDDPELIEHLEAENAYAEAVTAHLEPLREQLYAEFLGRLVEDDVTVPWVGEDGWTYWSQTKQGQDYPILLRERAGHEQVVLDENELAQGHDYFEVTSAAVSPSGELVAWLQDTTGSEHATLTIKNIATGEMIDAPINEVAAFDVAWLDDTNLYYLRYDHANRPDRVYRHIIGTPSSRDTLVADEGDERFWAGVSRLADGSGLIISLGSTLTSETRFIASGDADAAPVSVLPRTDGVEYEVDHQGDR
ncbi:MAG: hypothetical protein QGH76_01130, partial [Phycisphaerales bacterium]|nr:hypothetical protein [Phycisphaerales bacterium]